MAGFAVADLGAGEAMAREALALAAGGENERLALDALAWVLALRGRPVDELCARFRAVSDAASFLAESPERTAEQRLVWRGELASAAPALTTSLTRADEQGEPVSYALQRLHLCELHLRTGDWDAAEALLAEWAESAEAELLVQPMYQRCRALDAAGRGRPAEAEAWAARAIAAAAEVGVGWDRLEALRARGQALLLAREPAAAADALRAVWTHCVEHGIDEPGVFPVAPDLVEALAELEELDEARAVIERLERLAAEQDHPWARASAHRAAATVALAAGEDAAGALADAADELGALGVDFDRARTLLALGRALRRRRAWRAARDALERAAEAFDALGSDGWAEQARAELDRIAARRGRPAGELTPAEEQVARLAIEGRSNKEIAAALVVTVHTVEAHLSNCYAKLGIRSRTQLAGAKDWGFPE